MSGRNADTESQKGAYDLTPVSLERLAGLVKTDGNYNETRLADTLDALADMLARDEAAPALHPSFHAALQHLLTLALSADGHPAGSPLHAAAKDVRFLLAVGGDPPTPAEPPPSAAVDARGIPLNDPAWLAGLDAEPSAQGGTIRERFLASRVWKFAPIDSDINALIDVLDAARAGGGR